MVMTVTEFGDPVLDSRGNPTTVFGPPLRIQSLEPTGTSQQFQPWLPETRFVRLTTNNAAYMAWGVNPVATAQGELIDRYDHEYRAVEPGTRLAILDV